MNKNDKTPKLTARQRRFIDRYLISMNAADAARHAGYSEKAARQVGQRLLTNADIRAEIDHELNEVHEQQRRALIVLAGAAVSALQDVVINGRGLAKVNAANSILDRSGHKPVDHVKADIDSKVTATMDVTDARLELAEKFDRNFPITGGTPTENLELKPSSSESDS